MTSEQRLGSGGCARPVTASHASSSSAGEIAQMMEQSDLSVRDAALDTL